MPKSQLSVKAQVGLCLGVMLFFAVVLTITGFAASNQTRQKIAAFAREGATVTGTVTDKYIHSVNRNWVYWLDIRFTGQDGKVHNESTNVVNTLWDSYQIGASVQVTYVKSNPQWFYVPGDAPSERDIATSEGMFDYGLIASLLLLIALVVFLMWNRGGGTPNARIPSATPQDFTFQPSGAGPRSGFGTRQRL